jgi:hypothetical protein
MSDRGTNINGTTVHSREPRPIVNGRQVVGDSNAAGPLISADAWKMIAEKLEIAIEQVELSEAYQHHVACWAAYRRQKNLPADWRGHHDIFHYELLICGFKKLIRADRENGKGPRVRWRRWMRVAMPDDRRAALTWFHRLMPETRAMIAQSYRFEDAAQRSERRYIAKANRDHRAELEQIRGHARN